MVKANQNERRVGVFTCTGNFKYINMFFCVITPSGFKSYIYIYIPPNIAPDTSGQFQSVTLGTPFTAAIM